MILASLLNRSPSSPSSTASKPVCSRSLLPLSFGPSVLPNLLKDTGHNLPIETRWQDVADTVIAWLLKTLPKDAPKDSTPKEEN